MSEPIKEQGDEDDIPAEYLAFVQSRLDAGEHPGNIQGWIEDALLEIAAKRDWDLWGDGEWRRRTVCPVCGSEMGGICGCKRTEGPILYSEYLARQADKDAGKAGETA